MNLIIDKNGNNCHECGLPREVVLEIGVAIPHEKSGTLVCYGCFANGARLFIECGKSPLGVIAK